MKKIILILLTLLISIYTVSAGFVQTSGTDFTLDGSQFRFLGTNSYYLADYATDTTYDDDGNLISNSRQYVTEILDEARDNDLKVIRTWAFATGDTAQPYGGQYNLFEVGTPGNYNENTFQGLDWVISEAEKRGLKVMLVLVNNWDDYGGMKWYVDKSPTTNKGLTGDAYHDQFYTDPNCRNYYMNYVNNLLNRVNTITGETYKNDETIFGWSLANEPRAKSYGSNYAPLQSWISMMSSYIKSIDSNHLLTVGIEGWGTPWEGTTPLINHNIPNIDFYSYTLYADDWSWFTQWSEHSLANGGGYVGTAVNANSIDWWTTENGVTWDRWNVFTPDLGRYGYSNWVKQHVDWGTSLGMPVLLQEVGLKDDQPSTLRDKLYQQTINTFYSNGGDGILIWTLNHDNYYYSTAVDGAMDDGYGFYDSTDPTLITKSQPVFDAIDFAHIDNAGSSWTTTEDSYLYPEEETPIPEFSTLGIVFTIMLTAIAMAIIVNIKKK